MKIFSRTACNKDTKPLLLAVFFAAVVTTIYVAFVVPTLDDPFLMAYAWREAQSALGAQAIYNNVGWYFYPALCPPWQLAFEFPIYQAMTAWLAKLFSCDLIVSGRLISSLMTFISGLGFAMIVNVLSKNKVAAILAFCGFLINPYYLSWASAFLIESTALAFSIWGIYFSIQKKHVFAMLFLAAAMAIKATTAAPVLLVCAIFIALDFYKSRAFKFAIIGVLASVVAPLAIGVAWTNTADSIKSSSGYARTLSNKEPVMKEWAYGTWEQKTNPATWQKILTWSLVHNGGLPFVACLAVAFVLLPGNPLWREAAAALIGWLTPLIVFTNLYYVHAYYGLANNAFLLLFIAIVFVGAFQLGQWRKSAALLASVFMLSVYLTQSFTATPPAATTNSEYITRVGNFIKQNTPPESVVIVTGVEWNPLLSFVAERKTMMLPDWERIRQDEVTSAVRALPQENVFFLNLAPGRIGDQLAQTAIREAGANVSVLKPGRL